MATGYGPRSSRGLRTCAAQCLGFQFAVRGRTGQVAPMATGYGPRSSRGLRTFAAQCLGSQFAVRGRTGQVAPGAAGLWLVLIERVVYVRGVWLVGDWKGLAIGEFGWAQCIWIGQNPRAGWGQGAVLGFLARLGGAETGLGRTVSSLALPKNWMQKTQEYQ